MGTRYTSEATNQEAKSKAVCKLHLRDVIYIIKVCSTSYEARLTVSVWSSQKQMNNLHVGVPTKVPGPLRETWYFTSYAQAFCYNAIAG